MSATIYWPPSTDNDPASYDIERAPTQDGTFESVANVPHNFAGANYENGRFFYVDAAGSASSWYRVRTVDSIGQLGAWSSPFQAQMENAIVRVLITGRVLLPDGSAPSSGTIRARLSQAGSALDGTDSQRIATVVQGELEADGTMPEGFRLVPNDVITPTGTCYVVEFAVRAASGVFVQPWTEKWQLASSPDPIDVGAILRVSSPGANFVAGPQGPAGADGAQGPPGVVGATSPLAYDGGTKIVSVDLSSVDALVKAYGTLTPRSLARRAVAREQDPMDWGAIADGASHPLSTRYATLAQAQADYPHATALTQEIDWAAIQAAINAQSSVGGRGDYPGHGGIVCLPPRTFITNSQLMTLAATSIFGSGMDYVDSSSSLYGGGTLIDATAVSAAAAIRTPNGSTGNVFRDFTIYGVPSISGSSIGIRYDGSHGVLTSNVMVRGFSSAYYVDNATDSVWLNCFCELMETAGLWIVGSSRINVFGGKYANAAAYDFGAGAGNILITGGTSDVAIVGAFVDETFGGATAASVSIDGGSNIVLSGVHVFITNGGYGIRIGKSGTASRISLQDVRIDPFGVGEVPTNTILISGGSGHRLVNVATNPNGGGDISDLASDTTWINVNGKYKFPSLPSASPGAGSKQLWYDPADSNRVKFAS